ncbi:flagellar motor protein MotB [Lederbergia galactosidilytica]|uniref:Flagellar motor protein MotB n=1 Tax=Lederbergia galactosidilytica TaxID=217031 RepID=A0A177ZRN3_9BACI|nr:flagellar motor protein MotB [Lederbergia galactosidilytica]KRG13020.1 flagellar motor protein MotB [Virgibacillus soli]MBP1917086.1 chemotaxis protein MotB [Lederbergia galactosidilytica]OAK70139.1 flagellar motor protein MotB [Lederbergia galactosidilytica]
MARRKRKKRGEEQEVNESWLLPYSDLLTLLLALFIVLFASSSVDAQKFQQMSQVFNGIFLGGTGPIEYQNPVENEDHSKDDSDAGAASEQENEQQKQEPILDLEEQKELEQIQARINSYIKENEFNNKFVTSLTGEGLLLTIRDNVLFESGKAEVREEDKGTARELAKFLEMDPPRNIIISGHTDNIPIGSANFDSNWELSVMRAINFMKILLEDKELDPRWFSAKGFGEYQPIADNNTELGRAQNRRVEVLILPRVKSDE